MQTKDKDLYSKIYNEKIKFHFLFCRKCVFCKFLQKYRENNPKDNFDFNILHKLFLTLIEKENKQLGHQTQNYIHDVYDLLSNLKENACYNLKIHYQFKKLIKRYKTIDQNIENNIRIIYEDFCSEMKMPENIKWRQVSLLDLLLKEIKDILESIEEKIQYYSIITPSEITKLSEKFTKMETIQTLVLNERDNMQYYGLVIMRILNEEILNIPINKDEGLIRVNKNYNEEFLNYHYNEDKLLIVNVNLFNKKYTVSYSGKDLLNYIGKDFSFLFPEEFRSYAMNEFLKEVNKNAMSKTFEFIIKGNDKNENTYYPFIYNFYLTNGLGDNDFSIIGDYSVLNNNLVITESQKNNQGEFDIIYYLGKEMVMTLSAPNHVIEKKQEKGIFRSSLILSNLFKKISDKKYTIIKKNKRYVLSLFISFSSKEKTYKVFNCKQKNYIYANTKEMLDIDDDDDEKINEREKKKSAKYVVDSRSVNTTSNTTVLTKKIILNIKKPNYVYGDDEILKKYKSRFQNTKKLMIYFSLFLILFNIICLIIELNHNSKIIKMNNIYTNLRSANRMYYILISGLMSIVCFGDSDIEKYSCRNYYKEYSDVQKEQFNFTFNIFDYIIYENIYKLNEMIQRIQTLKIHIYELNDYKTKDAYEQIFIYKSISIVDEKIKVIEQEISFNNGIEIIINAVNIVLQDDIYFERPIYFFTGYPYYDFSNLRYIKNMTDSQIQFYNIIINYINYLKTWRNIQLNMYNNIHHQIINFDKISNYFMIISFLLHIWLGLLLMYYLYSFLNLFILRIDKVIRTLKKEKCKEFFKKKIDLLKTLSLLYKKNPNTILKDINAIYKNYIIAKTKQLNNQASSTPLKVTKKKKDKIFKLTTYFENLSHYFIYNIYIILYYIFIFILFMLLWKNRINSTKNIIEIIKDVDYAESSGFNGLSLIQLMYFGNQTEKTLGILLQNETNNYLSNLFVEAFSTFYIYNRRSKGLIHPISNYFAPNCKNFYENSNDDLINKVSELLDFNFKDGIIDICEKKFFWEYPDEKIFLQSLFFNLHSFVKLMKQGIPTDYIDKIINSNLFGIFDMEFLLYRPLRRYMNSKIFNDAITDASHKETIVLVIYLVVSNLTEIILLLIIYFGFIVRIRHLNHNIAKIVSVFTIKNY